MQVYQQFDVDIVPSARNFINYETPAQVISFLNTYFAAHLRRDSSNDMIIVRFFCKNNFSVKWKIKGYQR